MRFLVKQYEDGTRFAVETTDDGSAIVKPLDGKRAVGQRLSAFVEVLGDDTEDGVARIQDALRYLEQVVSERGREISQDRTAGAKRRD
jgi:hypothetical protein